MEFVKHKFFFTMDHKYNKYCEEKIEPNSSSIMQSIDVTSIDENDLIDINPKIPANHRDITFQAPFQSLPLHSRGESFLLIDSEENIQVSSVEDLMHLLDCPNDCKLKVVSIFGNSGDGKSYTLNHVLFQGHEIFKTSSSPEGGTQGVWAGWQPARRLLVLDTPALHQPNTPTTLLLKVLAISDVVIYRTRAERLPADLYTFLGQASKAYTEHFLKVLKSVGHQAQLGGPLSARGPAVIISHEPRHTAPLTTGKTGETAEEQIINRVKELGMSVEGLGSLYYTPTQPVSSLLPANSPLPTVLFQHLDNTAVRAARSLGAVLEALNSLSERFKGRLTCDVSCRACQTKCSMSMGHQVDDIKHTSDSKCRYQHQYENKVFVCKKCQKKVKEVHATAPQESWLGLARSAWNGYELHCPKCGPVYRSRQYWYGNKSPEETSVNTEIVHIWPGQSKYSGSGSRGGVGARRALEGVGSITGTLGWLADTIAPSYWQPTAEVKNCAVCRCSLEAGSGELHHCRACGMGVCSPCSPWRRPVPQRGWTLPVRVCHTCKDVQTDTDEGGDVTARKVGEAVAGALGPLAVALQYPKGVLTGLARPTYWTPDEEAPNCVGCGSTFGTGPDCTARHHCRRCGQSVCTPCSPQRQAVPERGWRSPVRVCNSCVTDLESI